MLPSVSDFAVALPLSRPPLPGLGRQKGAGRKPPPPADFQDDLSIIILPLLLTRARQSGIRQDKLVRKPGVVLDLP